MRTLAWITLVAVALPVAAVSLRADDGDAGAKTAEIEKLVLALGADDFRAREDASRRLAEIGAPARAALEQAVKSSASPEVRWRAEQLLRRFDGSEARPLGGGGEQPGAGDLTEEEMRNPLARIRRFMGEWSRRWEGREGTDPLRMPFGPLTAQRRLQVGDLVLERPTPGSVRLSVKRADESGAQVEDVFAGKSLRDILDRNPELRKHAHMAELMRREAEDAWPGFDDWFRRHMPHVRTAPGRTAVSFSTSAGVSIRQDADGVTVTVTEKDENGEPKTREYKGSTLEELKEKHPELREKIGGFGIVLRGPSFIWPGARPGTHLRPLPPSPAGPHAGPPEVAQAPFGLTLTGPDEVLSMHLGLERGSGALVARVRPASQAAEIGFQPYDVILKVNGASVDLASAVQALRQAGTDERPLTVELIRRGQPLTLSR
jgi:hypothetical protein